MPQTQRKTQYVYLLALLAFSCLVSVYLILRFNANQASGDAVRIASAVYTTFDQGTILASGEVYSHGFGYQTLATFLIYLTGQPLPALTAYALPFLLPVLILMAFVAYRRLAQDFWVALLGALMLAMQSEFLFTVGRGSHEKFTWLLTLFAFFILAWNFSQARDWASLGKGTFLFYLTAFALISINYFFASSFFIALAFSFLAALVLARFKLVSADAPFSRLVYIVLSCSVLVFLFVFYLYTPALKAMDLLQSVKDRLASLFLNIEVPFDPSAAGAGVGQAWTSQAAFLAVTSASWLSLFVSALSWLWLGGKVLKKQLSTPVFLLWLLYGGFAAQAALSVFAAGMGMVASNLQVRIFPVLMLVVMPIAALGITRLIRWVPLRHARWVVAGLAFLLVFWVMGTSVLKATNEPLISNNWFFRLHDEEQGLEWLDEYTKVGQVWLGLDRLRYASPTLEDPLKNRYDIYDVSAFVRYILISKVEETRLLRMKIPRPDLTPELEVYDNGSVQVYKFRPRTPYQR